MGHHLITAASTVLLAVPDPGQGTAPPGSNALLTVLKWAAWIGFGLGVLGVIIAGALMAVGSHQGRGGGHHAAALGWVMAGCVVIASAGGLVGALA